MELSHARRRLLAFACDCRQWGAGEARTIRVPNKFFGHDENRGGRYPPNVKEAAGHEIRPPLTVDGVRCYGVVKLVPDLAWLPLLSSTLRYQ